LCGVNSVFKENKCFCIKGFYLINGKCDQCKDTEKFDNEARKCVPLCDSTEILVDGECECPKGKVWRNSVVGCVLNCGPNEIWNDESNQCRCVPGFERIKGICIGCPVGMRYSQTLAKCITVCATN
jgi:hypothetical protein